MARAEEMTARGEGIPIGVSGYPRTSRPSDVPGLRCLLLHHRVDIPVDGAITIEVGMDRLFSPAADDERADRADAQ